MRPELINRIDTIGIFRPLSERHLTSVAERELKKLKEHLAHEMRTLSWDMEVKKHIVKQSEAAIAGARNIRQRVNDLVATLIADHLLDEPGAQDFALTINNGQIDLEAKTR